MGTDAERRRTVPTCRTVLVIIHSKTTAWWLRDLLPLLADVRIQLVFTRIQVSAFTLGIDGEVDALGGATIPWEQARATDFDLAICAGNEGPLDEIACPLLVLPHGPGYTKSVSDRAKRFTVSNSTTVLALTDPAQLAIASCGPDASNGPQTSFEVIGDVCWQNLCDGIPFREHYRQRLGVGEGQRLITISSTWGPQSLFATQPLLAEELLGLIDYDDTVIALVTHANIATGHGPRQVSLWAGNAIRQGLRHIDAAQGWRATVLASDAVLGDHGSVSYYAARLGIPMYVGSHTNELIAQTHLAQVYESAPRFSDAQEARSLCDNAPMVDLTLPRQVTVDATARLRSLVYSLLNLPEPAGKPPRRAPEDPRFQTQHPASFLVEVTPASLTDGFVEIRRRPGGVNHLEPLSPDQFLVTSTSERDIWLRRSADAIAAPDGGANPSDFPHARTLAFRESPYRWRVTTGTGLVTVASDDLGDDNLGMIVAAVAHRIGAAHLREGPLTVLCGHHTRILHVISSGSSGAQ